MLPPPPESGRYRPYFLDDYTSKEWLQFFEKDLPGLYNWQEAFKRIYMSKGQK